MKKEHIGSGFDDFLAEEGLLAETEAVALKRVIAYEVDRFMKQERISKTKMAERMHTSRTSIDRLLDPANTSITLATIENAMSVIGKRLEVRVV